MYPESESCCWAESPMMKSDVGRKGIADVMYRQHVLLGLVGLCRIRDEVMGFADVSISRANRERH